MYWGKQSAQESASPREPRCDSSGQLDKHLRPFLFLPSGHSLPLLTLRKPGQSKESVVVDNKKSEEQACKPEKLKSWARYEAFL
jgi:hypothetical protein